MLHKKAVTFWRYNTSTLAGKMWRYIYFGKSETNSYVYKEDSFWKNTIYRHLMYTLVRLLLNKERRKRRKSFFYIVKFFYNYCLITIPLWLTVFYVTMAIYHGAYQLHSKHIYERIKTSINIFSSFLNIFALLFSRCSWSFSDIPLKYFLGSDSPNQHIYLLMN